MKNLWQIIVSNWKDNYGVSDIKWKTTVGIGDSMYAFNSAYIRAFINQKPVNLELHYHFPKNYYYHFEDPESVDERAKFVLDRYMWKDIVNVTHVFNSQDFLLYRKKYTGVKKPWERNSSFYKYWAFDQSIDTTPIDNKIVLWRPTFNAEQQVKSFKFPLLEWEWERLINLLKDFGYDVVEIDYRTPIREAYYHIRTCDCCISYEGMWHYISKNFFKPHIVITNSNLSVWHTPAAHIIRGEKFFIDTNLKKITYFIESATEKANNYKMLFFKLINGY
tara:strand:- start:8208 stop:9038 length:831 start_codon:yes stop_codon:yes gene_type:complete